MGCVVCLEDYFSVLLLSYCNSSGEIGIFDLLLACPYVLLLLYSLSSGALESLDFLLSYSMITVALHNTITLIITHLSDQPLNQ